ncbi:MAG: isoprenylcysteine carboxylmethyltransferase family protein [Chloroflexi bacterium]|nr:isoprenylcysteine carboxylmethyltransferase family protein [Chloroflexota bacterium]MBU1751959.1 isoprenylcysteine carboxylmethyltransferase family protein [Chloroflexota bacterium]MBU1878555.1 isoprenylcysteine carboxylmethyltransferase family protein [Chloroflexota bacterium]
MDVNLIAWLNVIVLILSALLCLFFYAKSAGPAALERRIGERAYRRCAWYRVIASVFMTIASLNYVVYVFYPLPISLPRTFPWDWWVSALIAVLIAIPGGYLWLRGMKDAGKETMIPEKGHTLYSGIYRTIRHPQALGEVTFWWVIAFLLHSPFLVLVSFIWLPIFALMCLAEERDLVIRYGQAYEDYKRNTGFVIPKRQATSNQ